MSRLLALVGVVCLALAGCTASAEPTPTLPAVTREAPSLPPASSAVEGDEAYLTAMRELYGFAGVSDTTLLELGHTICDALDGGVSLDALAVVLRDDGGFDEELVGVSIAGAVTFLCPRYDAALNTWLED